MKIEMGESLFYSWLRHVKECQVVQTNWKPSPSWQLYNEDKLENFMHVSKSWFAQKYEFDVFGKNTLTLLLMQAEVDAIGTAITDGNIDIYTVDVAYHEDGLNYGDRTRTAEKVIQKLLRTAMCIQGYFNATQGQIIFASPKIHNAIIGDLSPCIDDMNKLFQENTLSFSARILANEDFNELVLKPILIASDGVSDTTELFLRAYQLTRMFGDERSPRKISTKPQKKSDIISNDTLSELKVGKIAQTLLWDALEYGIVNEDEVRLMQEKDYSKKVFGIDYPLLVSTTAEYNSIRYYTKILNIKGKQFRLCSQWFETQANNDRPLLLKWLNDHSNSGYSLGS